MNIADKGKTAATQQSTQNICTKHGSRNAPTRTTAHHWHRHQHHPQHPTAQCLPLAPHCPTSQWRSVGSVSTSQWRRVSALCPLTPSRARDHTDWCRAGVAGCHIGPSGSTNHITVGWDGTDVLGTSDGLSVVSQRMQSL